MRQKPFGQGVICIFYDWTETALGKAANLTK